MERDSVEAGPELAFDAADPVAARTLSAEQVEHYNELGFVSGLPVFDAAGAAEFQNYIDDLLEAVITAPDKRNSYSINVYHLVCQRLWEVATEPRVLDLVEDILGSEFVLWGSHLFAKMPNDGKAVPFHQDAVYWPLTPSKTVTVWLAVDDVDVGNAAMQFVPGSHREGPLEHETLSLDGTRVLGRQVKDIARWSDRFVNELPAGHASLHSDLLLHGSEANTSSRRRAGLTLRYAAASVRLIDGFEHWRNSSVHCRAGDPSGFWSDQPRPDGEHPERMAEKWGEFDGQPIDAS